MPSASDNVANRLKKAMEMINITQSKLAALVGTTQSAVSQWLSDKKDPSPENLADLAKHLRVELRWLVEGIPPMKTQDPNGERDEYKRFAGWGFRKAPDDGGR